MVYEIIDLHNYILMMLDGNLLQGLFEHERIKPAIIRTRSGKHTFKEDVYTRTLKYRRWNNELWPFCSLKKRVANMFQKRNSFLDSSRGISTQTIVNNIDNNAEENKAEVPDNDSNRDSDRDSIHFNWSEIMTVKSGMNLNASTSNASLGEAIKVNAQPRKMAVKNIVFSAVQIQT